MIPPNRVLAKLRNDEPALGGWILTGSPVVAELLALSGFDWVCIDAEHSAITAETAQSMMNAIENHGAEPFVRLAGNNREEIKTFLDMGARGIIVPMIKSYEEVQSAISYSRFPPLGSRSYALPRCTRYGLAKDDYFRLANENTFLGIMIEHADALPHLDRIFSSPHIDAVLVGPYDLSGSMGIPGQLSDPAFTEAMDLINRKADEHKIRVGFHEVHPSPEKVEDLVNRGFRFIACGLDTLFILEEAKKYPGIFTDTKAGSQ
jgi:2-dehydro-3-deoxyglucarate aldolase